MTRLLLVLVVLLCGCSAPPSGQRLSGLFTGALAGSSDLELTYESVGGPREGKVVGVSVPARSRAASKLAGDAAGLHRITLHECHTPTPRS